MINKDRIIQLAIIVRSDTGLDNYEGLVRLADLIMRETEETISDKALISAIRKWGYEKVGGPCSTDCPFYYKPCMPRAGSDKCHERLVKHFKACAKRMK